MEQAFQQREVFFTDDSGAWWYSRTAYIVKFSVLAGIFGLFFVWFVGGYFHARRRIKKGLPPLRYHRFLVPQHLRPRKSGNQSQFTFYRAQDPGYNLEQMPPPMYDPNQLPPPSYQPPQGGSKVNPFQDSGAGMPPSPSQVESQALPLRPATSRSPRAPWLSKILPKRNR